MSGRRLRTEGTAPQPGAVPSCSIRVDTIRDNALRGLAHAQGRVGGRPTMMTPERVIAATQMRAHGESLAHIAKVLDVGSPPWPAPWRGPTRTPSRQLGDVPAAAEPPAAWGSRPRAPVRTHPLVWAACPRNRPVRLGASLDAELVQFLAAEKRAGRRLTVSDVMREALEGYLKAKRDSVQHSA